MGNEDEDRECSVDDILAQTTDPRELARRLVLARRELRFMKMALDRQADRLIVNTTQKFEKWHDNQS